MARLGDVVKISPSTAPLVGEQHWLLNLDMVEQQTGQIIAYNYVAADELDGSIIQFDTDAVLYSKLRPNLNKVVLPERAGFATSEMLPLVPDSSVLKCEYLTCYLRSDSFVLWAVSKTSGAKMPRLGSKELLNKEIPLPSIAEQNSIVQQFTKVDNLISLRKQQLAKLDELVKSQFIEMFGDPVDNPMGWEKRQLQQLVSRDCSISYGIVKTGNDVDGGVPVFRPVDIVGKVPTRAELKRTTPEISSQYKRSLLTGRDLLVTVRANIADTFIAGEEFKGCNVGRGIVPVRTDESKIRLEFLKAQMDFDSMNRHMKALAKGITLIQLNMEDLRCVEFIVPPTDVQDRYIAVMQQTDKSKLSIRQSIEKLETLKKSLMQQYFG
ncbi:MAG: restriction endonuclease subunit S [Christensenellales bacterium]